MQNRKKILLQNCNVNTRFLLACSAHVFTKNECLIFTNFLPNNKFDLFCYLLISCQNDKGRPTILAHFEPTYGIYFFYTMLIALIWFLMIFLPTHKISLAKRLMKIQNLFFLFSYKCSRQLTHDCTTIIYRTTIISRFRFWNTHYYLSDTYNRERFGRYVSDIEFHEC